VEDRLAKGEGQGDNLGGRIGFGRSFPDFTRGWQAIEELAVDQPVSVAIACKQLVELLGPREQSQQRRRGGDGSSLFVQEAHGRALYGRGRGVSSSVRR
jgi:hypothetical protein